MLFVGRPEERKGLPVLLTAFEALVEHVPSRLTVIGAEREDVLRYLADPETMRWIDVRGRVSGESLWTALHEADLLCAPSLSGESFGMVLTEAFAAGTPAIASAIAGYSDVVTDGVDGVLVPPGDPQRLAEELQRAHLRARAPGGDGRGRARERPALRLAPGRRSRHLVYERAIEAPATGDEPNAPPTGSACAPPMAIRRRRRDAALADPPLAADGSRGRRIARRAGLAVAGALGIGLTALAAQKIGVDNVISSIVRSDVSWVLIACALMSISLFFRAASWYWIVRAALPNRPVRRRDVTSATMIGVLMSATLPARLGEPARAMTLARRIGRMRETFPVLLGTIVSQTVLNLSCPGDARGDHRLDHRPVPLEHAEDLRLQPRPARGAASSSCVAPLLMRRNGNGRFARLSAALQSALVQVRAGLAVFRKPRLGIAAAIAQLSAWAIQLTACWALLPPSASITGSESAPPPPCSSRST